MGCGQGILRDMKPKLDPNNIIYIVFLELCISVWEVQGSMQERSLGVSSIVSQISLAMKPFFFKEYLLNIF